MPGSEDTHPLPSSPGTLSPSPRPPCPLQCTRGGPPRSHEGDWQAKDGGAAEAQKPLSTPLPSCAVRQGDCDLEGATEETLPGTELNPASPTQSQDLGRGAGETQALNRIGSGMEPKGVGVAPKGQALPDPSPQLLARIPSPPTPRATHRGQIPCWCD